MANGEDSNTWGTITNTNWNLMEQAVTGVDTIVMANANYTLTNLNGISDEARNMVIIATGTTGGAGKQIIAPLVQKFYIVYNNTSDGYSVNIGASSGAVITIPSGVTAQVYCDGSNFYSAQTGSAGNFLVNGNLSVTGSQVDVGNMSIGGTLGVTGAASLNGGGTSTTPAPGDNSTKIATTAFVTAATGTLGTMATQNANNVNITGGTESGLTRTGGTLSGLATPLAIASGGTGASTLTANNVLLGNGTSALQTVAPSTSGNLLVSNGTTWTSASLASSGVKLGLGITGETWHNLTGTNVANQTYTNSRSYPIMVNIQLHSGSSGTNPSYLYVNGNAVANVNGGGWTGGMDAVCSAIVPPGATYSTNSSSAGSSWWELY